MILVKIDKLKKNNFRSISTKLTVGLTLISTLILSCSFKSENQAGTFPNKSSLQATHFHHVHLNVTNPKRTLNFYEKYFGAARLNYRNKSEALFTEKSFILLDSVVAKPLSNMGTSLWHIGWAGVDGHSEFEWRVKEGIEVETALKGYKLPTLKDSVHTMYFNGPDHEMIEIATISRNHRFEHIHLLVSDIETAAAWFKDQLGLPPAFEKAINFYGVQMNSFRIDNINLILFARLSPEANSSLVPDNVWPKNGFRLTDGSTIDHISFSYKSIVPVFNRMKSANLHIVKNIEEDKKYGFRSFFVRGPDGLLVEIVEEKPIPEGIWFK